MSTQEQSLHLPCVKAAGSQHIIHRLGTQTEVDNDNLISRKTLKGYEGLPYVLIMRNKVQRSYSDVPQIMCRIHIKVKNTGILLIQCSFCNSVCWFALDRG